jgi:hypothetical protein
MDRHQVVSAFVHRLEKEEGSEKSDRAQKHARSVLIRKS